MQTGAARFVAGKLLAFATAALFCSGITLAKDYSDSYNLSPASPSVDFGIQPLSYPSGVVSAAMRHDRILKKALAKIGQPLKMHPFLRSGDMLSLIAEHRLEGGMLGDQATILSSSKSNIWIVGLIEQVSTGIVAKGDTSVRHLAGKRIAYVEDSTAQYVLLQGLASEGLNESQVKLIRMRIDEMPDALERGEIDAFAGWDPATSVALRNSDKNHVVFRDSSTDFFVIDRDFARRSPKAAHHLIAGLLRAVEWMRRSPHNIEKAIRWATLDAEAFSGRPEKLSPIEIATIVRRNLLDIPSAPVIVHTPGKPLLKSEFDFLVKQGKFAADAKWEAIENSFAYDGLHQVLFEPKKFQVTTFDYED